MRTNVKPKLPPIRTHEGAPAARINAEQQLRRVVMASMLFEDQFYIDGESHADIIKATLPLVRAEAVAEIAIEAREKMKLRHVPLLLVREMARRKDCPDGLVSKTIARIIQRPDELAELLAIYFKDGKDQPIAAQVKKGLALAFRKFDAYQLAKYDREGAFMLRDVLFLTHAKPKDEEQAAAWKKLAAKELESPDTWEVALSAAKGDAEKRAVWDRLLSEKKLGALALLRNLRNMQGVGVAEEVIRIALADVKVDRVLPFRFISAAKYAPRLEDALEVAMLKCLDEAEKLIGKTSIVVDVSTSMNSTVSSKSEISRMDAANGVAMLAREVCETARVFAFNQGQAEIPPRRGFALRDAIRAAQQRMPDGTYIGAAVQFAVRSAPDYDRMIVITDEQSHDPLPNMIGAGKHYIVNIAAYQNGVGYGGGWNHINGWSEAVIDYIRESERATE